VWTVSIVDPAILAQVENIPLPSGEQGIYTAKKVGTTTISAEGRPHCDPGEMCAQYIILWKATVIVSN
jgi:hypothetical protein